jgi:hypothetical protein
MKERLNELRLDAGIAQLKDDPRLVVIDREGNVIDPLIGLEKFAELIVEECRTVVTQVYRKTPLELCGPLLTADEEIAKHFYGVEE